MNTETLYQNITSAYAIINNHCHSNTWEHFTLADNKLIIPLYENSITRDHKTADPFLTVVIGNAMVSILYTQTSFNKITW